MAGSSSWPIASHPLRITDRDVIKEVSVDEWFDTFRDFDLHVRVLGARDLEPKTKASLPDPYCKVICGHATHRTATQRKSLDPDWGEEFIYDWSEVAASRRQLAVEVWAWDYWRPDELLGRGFVDVNALAFEPLEVLELELQLHPGSVRKLKDIKQPQQQQGGKAQKKDKRGKGRDQGQQQQQQGAGGGGGPVSQLQRVLSQPLASQPSLRHYLLPGGEGRQQHAPPPPAEAAPRVPGVGQQQQQWQGRPASRPASSGGRDSASASQGSGVPAFAPGPQLGTVRVALWWAPRWRRQAFDVAERVSFCLLPGEVKVPPVVTHAKLGTLYEEPCVVYIKLSLLEVQLGGSWYLAYLSQATRASKAARQLRREVAAATSAAAATSTADWAAPGGGSAGLDPQDSLEAAVAEVVSAYHHSQLTPRSAAPRTGLLDFLGGVGGDGVGGALGGGGGRATLAEEMRAQQQQQALVQQHLAAEPVYALARLRFGKHQCFESDAVRLRPGGTAVFRECFVFTTKRPLKHKWLVLELVLRGKALPGGKLMARGEWSVVDLLRASPPPPTDWAGVFAYRRNQLPGMHLELQGIEGGRVELLVAAADADGRASMYGVPALSLAAATSAAAVPGGASPPAPGSPTRQGSSAASPFATPAASRRPSFSRDSRAPAGGAGSWLQWVQQRLPWPFSDGASPVAGSSPAGTPLARPSPATGVSRRLLARRPPPFAGSASAGTLAPGGAGGALAATPPGSPRGRPPPQQPAGDLFAGAGGIAGLPERPVPGALSGPLATLQLVVHRVELASEPPKGWWLLLKVGPHWAKSTVRRDSGFAWQLSVPIYHPTTTLALAVFADAGGRGKVSLLGKLTYRISSLMYLNRREVTKTIKLRTFGPSSIQQPPSPPAPQQHQPHQQQQPQQQQQQPESPHPPLVQPGITVSHVTGLVVLGFTCSIPNRGRLLRAYERSQYPPTVHHISLFHAASRDAIVTSHHAKVVAWLSSCVDPPVPPAAAWRVLETGRETFRLSRSRHNIHRLKAATSWVPSAWAYFLDLKAWARPWHNLASVAVMAAVCFRPIATLFAFLLWRSVVALRRLLMLGFVEALGGFADLGELFDSSGLLPGDLLYAADEDDDDDASSTSSGSAAGGWAQYHGGGGSAAAAAAAAAGLGGPADSGGGGSGGWGGGGAAGGVRDLAAIMVFQPRRLRMLKRRYDQLQRISLQVQNRIDDLAMAFERLQAMVTGQDPLATAIFFWRCLLLVGALWLAGPGKLLFCWWCWEVLRPPGWRAPPGVKGPVQFVTNLPSRSLDDV